MGELADRLDWAITGRDREAAATAAEARRWQDVLREHRLDGVFFDRFEGGLRAGWWAECDPIICGFACDEQSTEDDAYAAWITHVATIVQQRREVTP